MRGKKSQLVEKPEPCRGKNELMEGKKEKKKRRRERSRNREEVR